MRDSYKIESYAILLLAAGASTRMGKPKQLLLFNGSSLLRNATSIALSAHAEVTVVVLGADASNMQKEIKDMPVDIVINEQYKEGMASSIVTGLKYIQTKYPQINGILIMVCDQPYLNLPHIQKMLEVQKQSDAIAVSSFYAHIKGVPAIFHKDVFPELLQLKGDKGARTIIEKYTEESESVLFPLGDADIDTPEDYEVLIKKKGFRHD